MKTEFSVQQLEQILDERKAQLQGMAKKRDELQKEIDALDAEIAGLIGEGGTFKASRRRRRPKNERPLKAVVVEALKANKAGFSLADLAEKVAATGYKSGSRNFRNVLYQCLYNSPDFVHDAATGRYKLAK